MEFEEVLEDICARYLLEISINDIRATERLFFILEEAHWFYIDFYYIRNKKTLPRLSLKDFSDLVLKCLNIQINDLEKEFREFLKYKKEVPVHGAIILNRELDHILLVKGYAKNSQFFFPKGKKGKDEKGYECATREVYEEIGLDIENKISKVPFKSSVNKASLYLVLNVKMDTKFITNTRNEISEIKWVPLSMIEDLDRNNELQNVKNVYKTFKDVIHLIKKDHFRFDRKRLIDCFKRHEDLNFSQMIVE